jgi:GxxExxY protein
MNYFLEKKFKTLLDACYTVHSTVGSGLLESAYVACLSHELRKAGLEVATQVPMPLVYDSLKLEVAYRIDMLVEGELVVEIKAVQGYHPIHLAQLLTYMRLSGKRLGLLVNFHEQRMKDGIKRVVL